MSQKTLKFILKSSIVLILINSLTALAESPRFGTNSSPKGKGYSYTTDDNVTIYDYITIHNIDPTRSITIDMRGTIENQEGWFSFEEDQPTVAPNSSEDINFSITIPDNVCDGEYTGKVIARLNDYDNSPQQSGGAKINLQVNQVINFDINSSYSCAEGTPLPELTNPVPWSRPNAYINIAIIPNDGSRRVYFDKDGDGEYEVGEGDYTITEGTVEIYDSNDTLLQSTDLSTSAGYYTQPTGPISEASDFYVKVLTDVISNSAAVTTEKGNIFVDRIGTNGSPANSFQFTDITNFSQMTENIDIRSRNTDQNGVWEEGSISIGPDDKDQIISPLHWDELVDGTDFQYVDLDHDGRVDPDDKDHVISPLYWDFPN